MKKNKLSLAVVISMFLIFSVSSAASINVNIGRSYDVSLLLNHEYFFPEEDVIIYGWVTENGEGIQSGLCVNITDPNQEIIYAICTASGTDGYYELNYVLEQDAPIGTYAVQVVAHVGRVEVTNITYFDVVSSNVDVDSGGPYSGNINTPIQFFGAVGGGKPPYDWHWDFGDGNTSDQQNPIHSYPDIGEYYVTLQVTDSDENVGSDETSANVTEGEMEHNILVEYFTLTTCPPCVTASNQLFEIFDENEYNFFFVTYVTDKLDIAMDRFEQLNEGPYLVPDVYFDGGFESVLGGQDTTQTYENALINSSNRQVHDIGITAQTEWNESKLNIQCFVSNAESEQYFGTLRIYVVEQISRWNNNDKKPYHFTVLDLIEEEITVSTCGSFTSLEWDPALKGFDDFSKENIMIICSVFDQETNFVDDTTFAAPENSLTVKITNPLSGLYIQNFLMREYYLREIPLVVGSIDIEAEAFNIKSNIVKVEFYIDDEIKITDEEYPFEFTWGGIAFFKHIIKAVAYDDQDTTITDEMTVWKFF